MRLARLSIRLSGLQHDFPVEGPRRRDRHRDRTDPLDRGREGQQIANVKRYGEARNALASDSLKVLQVTARDRRNTKSGSECTYFERLTLTPISMAPQYKK